MASQSAACAPWSLKLLLALLHHTSHTEWEIGFGQLKDNFGLTCTWLKHYSLPDGSWSGIERPGIQMMIVRAHDIQLNSIIARGQLCLDSSENNWLPTMLDDCHEWLIEKLLYFFVFKGGVESCSDQCVTPLIWSLHNQPEHQTIQQRVNQIIWTGLKNILVSHLAIALTNLMPGTLL